MFRIFLKKKIYSGDSTGETSQPRSKQRNRRIYERFPVEQKHLTITNDEDILVIRDISLKGFASDVSERAFERFALDDIYAARMRYHGSILDMDLKVAWKRERQVGFELHSPTTPIILFFRNLVRPIQLAHSLSPVDASFMEDHGGMTWYHGEDVDLHIWMNDEEGLAAWRLVADEQVVEWSAVHGVKTGILKRQSFSDVGIAEPGEILRYIDEAPNPTRLRFASDIITSGRFPESADLAKTLEDMDIAI